VAESLRQRIEARHSRDIQQLSEVPDSALARKKAFDRWLPVPSLKHLSDFLDVAFFASLAEEEGRPITFSLAYAKKATAVEALWSIASFVRPLAFEPETIRRLSPALDASQTYMAVYPNNKDELEIWGLIHPSTGNDVYEEPHGLLIKVMRPGVFIVREELEDLMLFTRGTYMILEDRFSVADNQLIRLMFEATPFTPHSSLPTFSGLYFYRIASLMLTHGHGGTLLIVRDFTKANALQARRYDIENSRQQIIADSIRDELKLAQSVTPEKLQGKNAGEWLNVNTLARHAIQRTERLLEFVGRLTAIDGAVVMGGDLELFAFATLIDFSPGTGTLNAV
jgi:hypothetical protein